MVKIRIILICLLKVLSELTSLTILIKALLCPPHGQIRTAGMFPTKILVQLKQHNQIILSNVLSQVSIIRTEPQTVDDQLCRTDDFPKYALLFIRKKFPPKVNHVEFPALNITCNIKCTAQIFMAGIDQENSNNIELR